MWRFLDSGANTAEFNMALDEELLRSVAEGGEPATLRFYTWSPPAVSLGRFQRVETAVDMDACRRLGISVVRRITGGRAVLHNHELTYSIISRTDDPMFPNDVLGTYKVIAEGLIAGLRVLGISAEMVSRSCRYAALVKRHAKEPSCFSSPSWYEILVNGKKIIGSAQRRIRGAFLQHGSILIGHDPKLESRVIRGSSGEGVTFIERELDRRVSLTEVKAAFLKGISEALHIQFE